MSTYTIDNAAELIADGEQTIDTISEQTGWPIVEDSIEGRCLVPSPDTWHADDGNAEITIEGGTAEEAAQEYVDDGEWGQIEKTDWIEVDVWRMGIEECGNIVWVGRESHTVTLEPDVPARLH